MLRRAREQDVLRPLQHGIQGGRLRTAQAEELDRNAQEVLFERLVEERVEGQVIGVARIAQEPPADLDRREGGRDGRAG